MHTHIQYKCDIGVHDVREMHPYINDQYSETNLKVCVVIQCSSREVTSGTLSTEMSSGHVRCVLLYRGSLSEISQSLDGLLH